MPRFRHYLSSRWSVHWSLVGSFLLCLALGGVIQAADLTPESILNLINEERSKESLPTLKLNTLLTQAAQAKLDDMFENGYFAHTSPKGETPWAWVKQSGYSYQYAGENLAINYETAEKQHTAWMKSTTHRANILNARYQETGIAVKSGKMNGETVMITVQIFGTPRGGALSRPQKTQTPVRTEILPRATVPTFQMIQSENKNQEVVKVLETPEAAQPANVAPRRASSTPATWSLPHGFLESPFSWWSSEHTEWLTLMAVLLLGSVALALPAVFAGEAWKHITQAVRRTKATDSATTTTTAHPLLSFPKRPIVT